MGPDEIQGRWIIAQGWVGADTVRQALHGLSQHPEQDLCALLLARGFLSPSQARAARFKAAETLEPQNSPGLITLPSVEAAAPSLRRRSTKTTLRAATETRVDGVFLSRADLRRAIEEDARDSLRGRCISRYEILAGISRGKAGMIFKAQHRGLGMEVALKLLLEDDPQGAERGRFRREARLLTQLDHPNIVHVSDFGEDQGIAFTAMEYLSGQDLERFVKERLRSEGRALAPAWAARVLRDIAAALAFCHEHGVLHRAVKPRNIMVEEESGRPVLIDFGLVKRAPGRDSSSGRYSFALTRSGERVGHPAFMAPEQIDAKGFGEVGTATDAWGFGATLFFCLTGETPYPESSEVASSLALLTSDPRRVRELDSSVPQWLAMLCDRCLQRDSNQRPGMSEIAADLAAGLAGLEQAESEAEGPLSIAKMALIGLSIMAVTFALSLLLFSGEPVTITELEAGPGVTRQSSIELRGKLSEASAMLVIGGAAARPESDGSFRRRVLLSEGENVLSVEAHGEDGSRDARRVRIVLDRSPPRLDIRNERAGKLFILGEEGRLTGLVSDRGSCTLSLTGPGLVNPGVTLARDGSFAVLVEGRDEPRELALVARDEAGNETRLALVAISAAAHRQQQQRRLITLLADRARWQDASPELQDQAIAAVARRLGDGYEQLETQTFRCGGVQHRIARFRHRASRIELHLLPGDRYEMGVRDLEADWQYYLRSEERFRRSIEQSPLNDEQKATLLQQLEQRRALVRNQMAVEKPRHAVRIKPFLIGRFELRRSEWRRLGGQLAGVTEGDAELPVTAISWQQAQQWLARIGEGIRLPSEAEWEYACRAGTTTRFFWGSDYDPAYCWIGKPWFQRNPNLPQLARERIDKPNAFGLVDTLGNVMEWCQDAFARDFENTPIDGSAHTDAATSQRVLRGGSWDGIIEFCRSSSRFWQARERSFVNSGLRVALSIPEP